MLRSGVTAIFAYEAKSGIFFYTCEHAHTGTRPRGFSLRAVVPTMRLRVYSGRFVIFSNLNSTEGNMRLRKVCPQCNTILHAGRSVKDSSL